MIKLIKIVMMSLLTVAFLWVIGFVLFTARVLSDEPEYPKVKTDAVVIFTGTDDRIAEGLKLFARRRADKVLISGVYRYLEKEPFLKKWQERISLTIPCCVDLGYRAEDTTGNAQEVSEWVESNGVKSVRLVTSDYHMPRSYIELSNVLEGVDIIRHPVKSEGIQNVKSRFWHNLFTEYHKTIARWLHFRGKKR